jgi:hypothetical protein
VTGTGAHTRWKASAMSCDSGHTEPARRHWTEALDIYLELDIAEADLVRDRLAALT